MASSDVLGADMQAFARICELAAITDLGMLGVKPLNLTMGEKGSKGIEHTNVHPCTDNKNHKRC